MPFAVSNSFNFQLPYTISDSASPVALKILHHEYHNLKSSSLESTQYSTINSVTLPQATNSFPHPPAHQTDPLSPPSLAAPYSIVSSRSVPIEKSTAHVRPFQPICHNIDLFSERLQKATCPRPTHHPVQRYSPTPHAHPCNKIGDISTNHLLPSPHGCPPPPHAESAPLENLSAPPHMPSRMCVMPFDVRNCPGATKRLF